MKTFILAFSCVSTIALLISVAMYVHVTNKIIRRQEKELAKYRSENFKLQAAMRNKSKVNVIEIHDDRVDPDNIPDYRKDW